MRAWLRKLCIVALYVLMALIVILGAAIVVIGMFRG